jgi:hypothetical protein
MKPVIGRWFPVALLEFSPYPLFRNQLHGYNKVNG